jgi:YD repeat-containing protein
MINTWIKPLVWLILFCLLITSPCLAGTAQYTYDNLGRLIQMVYDNGATIVYTYDAAGNRTSMQVTASQASTPASGSGSGLLADSTLGQSFSFATCWGTIWWNRGESIANVPTYSIK